jgi:hypothetical protein
LWLVLFVVNRIVCGESDFFVMILRGGLGGEYARLEYVPSTYLGSRKICVLLVCDICGFGCKPGKRTLVNVSNFGDNDCMEHGGQNTRVTEKHARSASDRGILLAGCRLFGITALKCVDVFADVWLGTVPESATLFAYRGVRLGLGVCF